MTSAPGNGGKRPGAGRPFGAGARVPRRAAKDDERIKKLVTEVESAEYFVTNPVSKVFDGCSRDFLVAVYRAEQLPVRLRVYAACKAVEFEPPPAISGTPRPDTGEALVQAILRLKFTAEDEKKPPPQVIPPALPRPRVRPKPPPVTDVAETVSAEHGTKNGGNTGVGHADPQTTHQLTHHSVPDSEHSGGNSEPEPVRERTQEEWRDIAGTPLHLRRQ